MKLLPLLGLLVATSAITAGAADLPVIPHQEQERTCFQCASPYRDDIHIPSDVAIAYGIGKDLPDRIKTWTDQGYRVHVMTGVSWGNYQDYLYGRFDGKNHEDEAQTDANGNKISHGGDVYYMSPGINYGKFLCEGVKEAMDAGAQAIHLEEPEFWVRAGYSEGFKREWKEFYGEDWQDPQASADAQWRCSKLKYYLYRRALQQVFSFIQDYNKENNKAVRCYVPTHSLLNYTHWGIVSPESSLAKLEGCNGYIAQVWTGTARSANFYRGEFKERTFETAFCEYSSMYNLVRSTGRTVWYLNDPVEDNPAHDWNDYRQNWESTLTASLLQPEVWRYEVMPWPARVFRGKYPSNAPAEQQKGIPLEYATELQIVINALNDMNQEDWKWDNESDRVGQFVSDTLMFSRFGKETSDPHMGHVYGMAMPLVKRGIPLEMVQLENVGIQDYLKGYKLLLLSYTGMKPMDPSVHTPIVNWVRKGGVLFIEDDDKDLYNNVREWWNTGDFNLETPRHHLMDLLKLDRNKEGVFKVGKGYVCFHKESPVALSRAGDGDTQFFSLLQKVAAKRKVKLDPRSCFALKRGPYFIAAGLDDSLRGKVWGVDGRFVNLFDPELELLTSVDFLPGKRYLLLNLDKVQKSEKASVLASGCQVFNETFTKQGKSSGSLNFNVLGIEGTRGIVLASIPDTPKTIVLDGKELAESEWTYDAMSRLLRFKFDNHAKLRACQVGY